MNELSYKVGKIKKKIDVNSNKKILVFNSFIHLMGYLDHVQVRCLQFLT